MYLSCAPFSLKSLICFHAGPLEDADEWKEEDFDFQTPGFSAKAASPTYTRKIIDPLGGTPSISRRGSRTVDLKEMFPNGELGSLHDERCM